MYGVLQRRLEWEGIDQQERLMLSIDKMFSREQNNALEELFGFWREKQQYGDIPRLHNFQYKESLSADTLYHVSWADVTEPDPYNFITRDHRKQTAFRDHSNCRLGDYPSRMNLRALAAEYIHCIQTRKPIYHEIEQTIGSISRQYVRLMLPVADESGRIVKLVYAVRILKGATSSVS